MEPVTPVSQPEYVYTPFPKGKDTNIRLFRIKPGKGDDPIELELFESSGQPYIALSYVWGDAKDTLPISVDGKCFKVTRNLYGFLKMLRQRGEGAGPFWADAVCINQMDVKEKNVQVAMMDKIYSETKKCVVWLGDDDENVKMAVQMIRRVVTVAIGTYKSFFGPLHTVAPALRPAEGHYVIPIANAVFLIDPFAIALKTNLLRLAPNLIEAEGSQEAALLCKWWNAVYTFWDLPWFQRMWTLQEFVLPPSDPEIRCGSTKIDATSLLLFTEVKRLYADQMDRPPGLNTGHVSAAYRRFAASIVPRARYHNWDFRPHIIELVTRQRPRLATDPRDKIFAVFGLTTKTTFKVDYAKPVQTLYHDFAVWCTKEGQLSSLLEYAHHAKQISDLPTWVPDWTRACPMGELIPRLYKGAGCLMPPVTRFSRSFRSLHTPAILLDSIQHIHHAPGGFNVDKIPRVFHSHKIKRPPFQSYQEAILRTKAADSTMLRARYVRIPPASAPLTGISAHAAKLAESLVPLSKSFIEAGALEDCTLSRVLFMTSRGYIGLGPEASTSIGDIVAIIPGVILPVILRQKERHYEVVDGQCYVHAAMDGEIMEQLLEKADFTAKEIELR